MLIWCQKLHFTGEITKPGSRRGITFSGGFLVCQAWSAPVWEIRECSIPPWWGILTREDVPSRARSVSEVFSRGGRALSEVFFKNRVEMGKSPSIRAIFDHWTMPNDQKWHELRGIWLIERDITIIYVTIVTIIYVTIVLRAIFKIVQFLKNGFWKWKNWLRWKSYSYIDVSKVPING